MNELLVVCLVNLLQGLADKMVELREILPRDVDVSWLVARNPSIVLDLEVADVKTGLEQIRCQHDPHLRHL